MIFASQQLTAGVTSNLNKDIAYTSSDGPSATVNLTITTASPVSVEAIGRILRELSKIKYANEQYRKYIKRNQGQKRQVVNNIIPLPAQPP